MKLVIWWWKINLVNVAYETAFISIIEVGKVRNFWGSSFDAGAKPKAYEEIADLSSYEPGHPTSPEQAQAESTMERDYE